MTEALTEYKRIKRELDEDEEHTAHMDDMMERGLDLCRTSRKRVREATAQESDTRQQIFARAQLTDAEEAGLRTARDLRAQADAEYENGWRLRKAAREEPERLKAARTTWQAASDAWRESRLAKVKTSSHEMMTELHDIIA